MFDEISANQRSTIAAAIVNDFFLQHTPETKTNYAKHEDAINVCVTKYSNGYKSFNPLIINAVQYFIKAKNLLAPSKFTEAEFLQLPAPPF